MSADEFWNGDSELVRCYRKAEELRQEKEDTLAWLQGKYVYEAIGALSPILHAFAKKGTRPNPYLEKPMHLHESEPTDPMEKSLRSALAWASSVSIANEV